MVLRILSMLIVVGMLSALPMIYTGKLDPLALIDSGFGDKYPGFSALKSQAPENLSNVVPDEKVQVYRWRDENGVMQFSNTPPPAGMAAEQVVLDPDSNLMQAVKEPEAETKQVVQAETVSPNPYSIKGMEKVMEDARAVESMLQQRHEQQQKMLNDL